MSPEDRNPGEAPFAQAAAFGHVGTGEPVALRGHACIATRATVHGRACWTYHIILF